MFFLAPYLWIIIQYQTNQKAFDLRKIKSLIIIKGLRLEKLEGLKNILWQTGESNINLVYTQTEDVSAAD